MAANISGAVAPSWLGLFYWIPIRWHRRQLHRFQPGKGGIRSRYGSTRSLGLTRGTLVRHVKYGLTYIGGNMKGRVSLRDMTGEILTRSAKVSDLKVLTVIRYRTRLFPSLKAGVFAA